MADTGFSIGKIQKRPNLKALARGMKEKATQGKMLYTLPSLGYTWTEVNPVTGQKGPGGQAMIRVEDVPLVQLIFDRYERVSARQMALSLKQEGYRFRSRHGEPLPFRAATILRIVTNPIYAGMVGLSGRY